MARTVVKNLDGARMLRETGWSGLLLRRVPAHLDTAQRWGQREV